MAVKDQDFEAWAGDHATVPFTVDGLSDLATEAQSVRWKVAGTSRSEPIISKSSESVSEIAFDDNKFDVFILPEDTVDLSPKKYYHEAEVIDINGIVKTVAYGTMTLHPTIIK